MTTATTQNASLRMALKGIRVLDMTSVVMGPLATQMLGDFGADVIKVEAPEGDTTRKVGPMRNPGMGWVYLHLNRNKRSLVLDLKQAAARDALLELAKTVDVVVSSVRPAAMARLGLTHQALCAVNPKIISVSLVGFGDGPYAGKPVYEDLIQGLTSVPMLLMSTGSPAPQYVPLAFNDRAVGVNAAFAIAVALFHRERSGEGQEIQVPMFETMAQVVLGDHFGGNTFSPSMGPPGYLRTLNKERRPYPTVDGHICVIIYTDTHWNSFLKLVGQPDLLRTDARFADIGARTQYASTMYELISKAMLTRTSAEWLGLLERADIPAAPLHTLESLFDDPHLNATGFLRSGEHPTEGPVREMWPPGRWSATPPAIRIRAPRLGEHSAEVLAEAGISADRILALEAQGAVRTHPARRVADVL
jgi:crotonobetainyl-CoA:carnitine CoA-transferase CaiB-like acyl-CoA transferase